MSDHENEIKPRDHSIEDVERNIDLAASLIDQRKPEAAQAVAQIATAQAILALVKRLDALTGNNLSGDDYLRIRNQ